METATKHLKLYTTVVVGGCFLLSGIVTCISYRSIQQSQNRIYILAAGKAMEAMASDRRENLPVEARDHIWNFHRYFFSLSPDEKAINNNLAHAFYLADNSARKIYQRFNEAHYYTNVVAGNMSQEVTMDSIVLDMQSMPYFFRFYGQEKIIRPTTAVTRRLWTEGQLRLIERSDNNPHGFLIEKWVILDNRDLKAEAR